MKQIEISNPTILAPRWQSFYMGMAEYVSVMSKDPSTKCGAVIVRPDKTQCSIGFNGLPSKIPDDPDILNNRNKKYDYIIHAEENAITNSKDSSLEGYALFVYPFLPCPNCMSSIINNGLGTVYSPPTPIDKVERWKDRHDVSIEMANRANVKVNIIENTKGIMNEY